MDGYEMQVRAANIVRAGESLMNLVSDIKQFLILNDFPSTNESIMNNNQKFRSGANEMDKVLLQIRDEMCTDLFEMEEEYYLSTYKWYSVFFFSLLFPLLSFLSLSSKIIPYIIDYTLKLHRLIFIKIDCWLSLQFTLKFHYVQLKRLRESVVTCNWTSPSHGGRDVVKTLAADFVRGTHMRGHNKRRAVLSKRGLW